jgi:hypothetical protein
MSSLEQPTLGSDIPAGWDCADLRGALEIVWISRCRAREPAPSPGSSTENTPRRGRIAADPAHDQSTLV